MSIFWRTAEGLAPSCPKNVRTHRARRSLPLHGGSKKYLLPFLLFFLIQTGRAENILCTPPPTTTVLEEWMDWRNEQVDFLLQAFEVDGQPCIEILGVAERAISVRNALAASEPRLQDHPRITQATSNLKRFADAVSWQMEPGHEMGFPSPDSEYLDSVHDQIQLPALLRSQPFLEAMSHPSRYAEAQRLLDEENATREEKDKWVTLFYRSRFIETPDQSTHGRLLIWVPGNPEQWIQFGTITPEMDPETITHGVSIVSLLKQNDGNTRTAIVDYWREAQNGRIELQTKVEAGEGGANCYNCHKTSVLPIRPWRIYALDDEGTLIQDPGSEVRDTLKTLNDRLKTFGSPDFGFGFDTEAYGPSVGPPDQERSLDDLQRWIQPITLPPDSLKRVRKAMNCAGCHNPSNLGRLNFPSALISDHDFIDLLHPETRTPMPLIQEYIAQGWMPPHHKLSPLEKKALYQALMKEYFDVQSHSGVLVEWLKKSAN